ncbi:MAG: carbonic anhydrase [Caulobacterales bacterium]|nr:carbonic anhydrase [Caulobacterales bacterium]
MDRDRGLTLSRRGVLAGAPFLPMAALATPHAAEPPISPILAQARLDAGNARFVAGQSSHPNLDARRRAALAGAQHPFAVILACADSRVAPELIFDQGLGDLFVVRVAGNVVDEAVLASVEYAVIHLGCALAMVLGHERCGAVQATVEALAGHGSPQDRETRIGALAKLIAPAVRAVPASSPNRVDAAVRLNAANAAVALATTSPPLMARIAAGRLKVVAARYDLDNGRVTPVRI